MQNFTVNRVKYEEVNRDFIRIHKTNQYYEDGTQARRSDLCKISAYKSGKLLGRCYALLQGIPEDDSFYEGDLKNTIRIDETLRGKLGIEINEEYDFEIKKPIPLIGQVCYACNASDPGFRIATRIAVILGVISVTPTLVTFLAFLFRKLIEFIPHCTMFLIR